jgi:PAS domain-containing protein
MYRTGCQLVAGLDNLSDICRSIRPNIIAGRVAVDMQVDKPKMTTTSQGSFGWGALTPSHGNEPKDSLQGDGPGAENRREQRHAVDQPVQVFPPGTAARTWNAHIRDISTRGMRLLVNEPLSFGPEIRIRWNEHEVKGTILYNHRFDSVQYRIGVELSASCESLLIEILASQAEELRHTKLLVEQQKASLERAVGLLDLASDALIVTSPGGTILFWNRGAEQLYGWTREEAVGRQLNSVVESAGHDGMLSHRRKDGTSVVVTGRSIMLPETQGLPEVVASVRKQARG